MWNKDSEKNRSNSGTKFVPFKLYLVHRRSLEKIRTTFDTIPVFFQIFFKTQIFFDVWVCFIGMNPNPDANEIVCLLY